MNNPFLNSTKYLTLYISIWVILIITQIFLLNYFYSFLLHFAIVDCIACNAFQALCILALWYPVRYYRSVLSIPLFLLFHLFLAILSLVIWMSLGFFLSRFFLYGDLYYTDYFLTVLPVRIFIGLLLYIIFVLVYYLFFSAEEIKLQNEKMEEVQMAASSQMIEKIHRISVKKNNAIHFIPVDQVMYIEANGDYVLIHTKETKFLKDRTMKYWEAHLPDDCFVRIHRSFIVNLEYIHRIELYEKDSYRIKLKNENILKVSNAGYKLLKQKMQ